MTGRIDRAFRRNAVSLMLLASMLFYVSGIALGLHLALEHSHVSAVAANNNCRTDLQGREGAEPSAPADTPASPSKKHCDFCDMLTGVSKPMAIILSPPPVLILTHIGNVASPDQAWHCDFTTSDISRRGPPMIV